MFAVTVTPAEPCRKLRRRRRSQGLSIDPVTEVQHGQLRSLRYLDGPQRLSDYS